MLEHMFDGDQPRAGVCTLRSAVQDLQREDPASLSDTDLEAQFEGVQRASQTLESVRLRLLAEIERREAFRRDGHLSAQAWLASRFRMAFPAAATQVRTARALEQMPQTQDSFASGELSSSAVQVLVSAKEASPEAFADSEVMLVAAARALPARDLQRSVADWRERVQAEGATDAERLRARRRLEVSPMVSGMVRVEGDLDPEAGQTVITALRAVVDAGTKAGDRSDPRTPTQRRADALQELCRQWLDRSDRPQVGGERPHLTVVVDLETLENRAGRRGEVSDVGAIDVATVRRLACDGTVSRVITRGRSEPLDVGRRTPVVPAALRRAVVVRDRHCRFPGCDRPPGWSDAHHVRHWADGGETALSNLILLCRPHHRMTHSGFTVEMVDDGHPVFRKPDGTQIGDRAPP